MIAISLTGNGVEQGKSKTAQCPKDSERFNRVFFNGIYNSWENEVPLREWIKKSNMNVELKGRFTSALDYAEESMRKYREKASK